MWENCNKCKLVVSGLRDLSRHSGQILSCDGGWQRIMTDITAAIASLSGPAAPTISAPRLSPSLITSHHSPMLQMWKHEAFVPSLESKFMLTRLKHCNGTHVILTHSKLTHDWHEYLFSYKRCKSFPQLNCDADKSCHNKQYLWLRRLWAIVAVRAVTKKIKLLNEWVDSISAFNRAIYSNKGFVSSLMESPFAN